MKKKEKKIKIKEEKELVFEGEGKKRVSDVFIRLDKVIILFFCLENCLE